jgi:hypothetical protein
MLLSSHRFQQTGHRFVKCRSTSGEDQAVFQLLEIDKKSAGLPFGVSGAGRTSVSAGVA